ncbi:hypothetical protein AGIG_G6862 [Arapaima gigas]
MDNWETGSKGLEISGNRLVNKGNNPRLNGAVNQEQKTLISEQRLNSPEAAILEKLPPGLTVGDRTLRTWPLLCLTRSQPQGSMREHQPKLWNTLNRTRLCILGLLDSDSKSVILFIISGTQKPGARIWRYWCVV